MPIIRVEMLPGRSEDVKAELAKVITDAIVDIAKAPRDGTIVVFQDVSKSDWAEGGVLLSRR